MVATDLPIPAWFKYRQCEAKPVGENCFEVTAPQMEPAYIRIRQVDGQWEAAVADAADAPDRAVGRTRFENERDAWQAAFELYRVTKVI